MQTETAVTHHVLSFMMTIIKSSNNSHYKNPTKQVFLPKTEEGAVEAGICAYCWWECKMVQLLWKQHGSSSKNITRQNCHMTYESHFCVLLQKHFAGLELMLPRYENK